MVATAVTEMAIRHQEDRRQRRVCRHHLGDAAVRPVAGQSGQVRTSAASAAWQGGVG